MIAGMSVKLTNRGALARLLGLPGATGGYLPNTVV